MKLTDKPTYEVWDEGAFKDVIIAVRGALREVRTMVEAGWSQEYILNQLTIRGMEDSRPIIVQLFSTFNLKAKAEGPQYWDSYNPVEFADTEEEE